MLRVTWKVSWVPDLYKASQAFWEQLGSCTNRSSSPQTGKTPHNEKASAAAKSAYEMQMSEQDPGFSQDLHSLLWFEPELAELIVALLTSQVWRSRCLLSEHKGEAGASH